MRKEYFLVFVVLIFISVCFISFVMGDVQIKLEINDKSDNTEIQSISYKWIMENVNKSNVVKVKVGEKFVIGDKFDLESNPSTGYNWKAIFDKSKINLLSHKFEPPGNNFMGSPGKDLFIFEAIKPGTTTLSLKYLKEWEDMALREETIKIEIN